nr:MAG TPA: hypothetical protein [Caudoviricetes sp.]
MIDTLFCYPTQFTPCIIYAIYLFQLQSVILCAKVIGC